jgi:hypothetical protein
MRKLLPLAGPCAVLLALGWRAPLDELGFHPTGSLILTKTFSERSTFGLDSMDQTVNGEPLVEEFPEVEGLSTRELVLTDELRAVGDGRVDELLRTYETISAATEIGLTVNGMDESRRVESGSELEETAVLFKWNAEEESYDRSFEEGETGDAEMLARLDADLEFTGLLPPGEVGEGDTWDVPAQALRALLVPGGDLSLVPLELEEGGLLLDDRMLLVASLLSVGGGADSIEGEVKATYRGVEEAGGRKLARIELAMDVVLAADHTARLLRSAEEVDFEDPGELASRTEIDGEVQVTWDLAGGHVAGVSTDADVALTFEILYEEGIEDFTFEIEGTFELSGTTRIELVVER